MARIRTTCRSNPLRTHRARPMRRGAGRADPAMPVRRRRGAPSLRGGDTCAAGCGQNGIAVRLRACDPGSCPARVAPPQRERSVARRVIQCISTTHLIAPSAVVHVGQQSTRCGRSNCLRQRLLCSVAVSRDGALNSLSWALPVISGQVWWSNEGPVCRGRQAHAGTIGVPP